jgi:hypothetical protein
MILTISSDDDGYLIYSLSRRREREGVRVDIYDFPPHCHVAAPYHSDIFMDGMSLCDRAGLNPLPKGEEIMISYVLGYYNLKP